MLTSRLEACICEIIRLRLGLADSELGLLKVLFLLLLCLGTLRHRDWSSSIYDKAL